ncbi:MAG: class I SAM-dependent methyltransferase [bacterium]|nr:class I SAM-dependent methyltransferase [bacterium]
MNAWQLKQAPRVIEDIAVYSKLMSQLYDNSWYGTFSNDEIDFFLSYIKKNRVLEIGSGTGRISLPLLESGADIFGIEGSTSMFDSLLSKLSTVEKERFINWDARRTPYPAKDQAFDCIIIPFSTFALIHNNVENAGENRLFYEFNRLLQQEGLLIINDYRVEPFDRRKLQDPGQARVHEHHHHDHGLIREEQYSNFVVVPNRLFPAQIIRERRTVLIRVRDEKVLEEHFERIPIWDTNDFPLLGKDAGFSYLKGELCGFHADPSIHHIFQKSKNCSFVPQ